MRRLYNAICAWIETDTKNRAEPPPFDPQPEGNNFAQVERSYHPHPHELHAANNHQSIDDDDGGAYKIGFTSRH